MTGLWIRVVANIGSRKVTWRACDVLGTSVEASVGHLVMLWGKVAENTKDGFVGDVPDALLEEWARWRGEPGRFAQFVREHHVTQGVINEWNDYAGALETKRENDRKRKQLERERKTSDGRPRDVTPHGTERNGTEPRTAPPLTLARAKSESYRVVWDALPEPYRVDLDALLDIVPAGETWCRDLRGILEGDGRPRISAEQLGVGIRHYVQSGRAQNSRPRQFWRYVTGAAPDAEATSRPVGAGRRSPGQEGYDNAIAATGGTGGQ